MRADVVVVGGGLTGSAISYYLAKAGVRVVLLEKGDLCSEASGANQGGCPVLLTDSPITELILEGHKAYKGGLSEELGCDLEYQETGSLACTTNKAVLPLLEEHARHLERQGVSVRVIDRDALLSEAPYLGAGIVGFAVECPNDFTLNPFKVTYGFAHRARELGAQVLHATPATGIRTSAHGVEAVTVADRAAIHTKWVVDAAGAWSPQIGKMIGIDVPVNPVQGQVLVTSAMPLTQFRYILDADWLNPSFDVAGSYVQEAGGNWTIGASKQDVCYSKTVTHEISTGLLSKAVDFLPFLRNAQVIRSWAGLRPNCYYDGLPILGNVRSCRGFVEATGVLEGVKLAPVIGKLIAELIVDGRSSISLERFAYERILTKTK